MLCPSGSEAVTENVRSAFSDPEAVAGAVTAGARSTFAIVIEVEAWRRCRHGEERELVTQANFTFVAVGEDRKPRPVDG